MSNVSAIFFININIASTIPTSMATTRSNTTVKRNVRAKTERSVFVVWPISTNSLNWHILKLTTIRIAESVAIGISFARGIATIIITKRTIAWTIPATGVLPPFLILVAVLAIAPVAGSPPKSADAIFAIPCAISSWLESCLSPVIPSATTAERSDSIPAKMAIVTAGWTKAPIFTFVKFGIWGIGIAPLRSLNFEPIVCTSVAIPFFWSK